jgi:hypothetical protein
VPAVVVADVAVHGFDGIGAGRDVTEVAEQLPRDAEDAELAHAIVERLLLHEGSSFIVMKLSPGLHSPITLPSRSSNFPFGPSQP